MDILYEIWLHCVCGFEPDRAASVVSVFENAEDRFKSDNISVELLKELGIAGDFAEHVTDPEFFKRAREIIAYCKNNDIRIITQESDEYPFYLKNIDMPPRILFAKGERLDLDNRIGVGVVGCRKSTPNGRTAAFEIGTNLAKSGITVVSGMAEGIDAEAHRAAVKAGGKTVAVLAGSVDNIYPRSNEKLYYEIMKNGTIISERPPETAVQKYFYRQRNRIIVGLSRGVVIVEGRIHGGTAITAEWASESNRDVFAVPGSPVLWQSELPNSLISDGAMMIKSFSEPVDYYMELYPEMLNKSSESGGAADEICEGLSDEERRIYDFLSNCGGVAGNEEIMENCAIPLNRLNVNLTMMSIKGIIRQESGNRYIINRHKN